MAQSKLAKRSAPPVSPGKSAVARLVREGVLILLLAACAFSVVALTSYHASDPGWSKTGVSHQIQNAGGPAGAWLADVSFSLFGALAYIFPLLIAIQILILLRHRVQPPLDMVTVGLKTVGLFLLMLAGTGLAVQHAAPQFGDLPFSAGGILGMWAADAADAQFGLVGGTLLLLTVFIFGVTIFFDISWFAVMDALGGWALAAVAASQRYLAQEWAAMRERRAMAPVSAAPPKLKRVKRPKAERSEPLVPELMDYDEPTPVEPRLLPQPKPVTQLKITPPKPAARQQNLFEVKSSGELPSIGLLDAPDKDPKRGYSAESLQQLSRLLELKLQDFGIVAEVVEVLPGPVVTRFEIQPAPGVKVSRITNLAKDLARSLAVISVRVVEVIEGKSVVGIEIPNQEREMVRLSAVLASAVYEKMRSPLTLALGHDISGQPMVADLAKMPHLLVAGTTGSGKSVGVNAMLLSLLYKAGPDQVRLLLVDPKMLELSIYEGIPHLLAPVITDMKDAATGLRWCVGEMERRYKLMAALGVRNLAGYNKKVQDARQAGEPILDPLWKPDDLGIGEVPERPELATLPFIVVVIDEFADMMMIVGKKVEQLIARIAQKARAAGIHLVLATQRPSVDVITGLIKANIPTRMAFQVSSKIDSRTILDQGGAEQLLGHGDMLYLPPGTSLPVRVHGAFVDDHEVHAVVADWKSRGEPQYLDEIFSEQTESISVPGYSEEGGGGGDGDAESDPLYDEAVAHVLESRKASISSVQRKLRIGYNRAARLIEQMEMAGVVSAMSSNGNRDVIAPPPPR